MRARGQVRAQQMAARGYGATSQMAAGAPAALFVVRPLIAPCANSTWWASTSFVGGLDLAEHGLVISAGKMSGLWSGQPVSLKLEDLNVICVVLGCEIGDLLIPEPGKVPRPGQEAGVQEATTGSVMIPAVVPKRRDGRSLPPM